MNKEIPASPVDLVNLSFFIFFWFNPPKAIILLAVCKVNKLNFDIPSYFLFLGLKNIGLINIFLQP